MIPASRGNFKRRTLAEEQLGAGRWMRAKVGHISANLRILTASASDQRLADAGADEMTTGANGNILRVTPPLVITASQVDQAFRIIDEALAATSASLN